MEDPLAGPPVTVRYEVASNGRPWVEYQNAGQSFEMVTVYFWRAASCTRRITRRRDQRRTSLAAIRRPDLALLEFDGGGIDAGSRRDVHQGEIRFISPDRIGSVVSLRGPKEQGVTHCSWKEGGGRKARGGRA